MCLEFIGRPRRWRDWRDCQCRAWSEFYENAIMLVRVDPIKLFRPFLFYVFAYFVYIIIQHSYYVEV